MSFEYAQDDIPNTPAPWFPGWGVLADLWGQQAFKGPIRGYAGDVWNPTYTFDAENRTGWYQPWENSIGAAIAGFLRFYVDEVGTTYRNTAGFGGTIAADSLTANQFYQLPNASGTLALEEDIVSTMATYKTIIVTDTPTLVLGANSNRLGYAIENQKGSDVYIGFTDAVVVGDVEDAHGGLLLNRDGGAAGSGGAKVRYVGDIYAIAPAGLTAILSVVEFLP